VELKDIKAIIDLMKKNSITEFELEEKDSKLRLKRGLSGGAAAQGEDAVQMIPAPVAAALALPAAAVSAPAPAPVVNSGEIDIKSPMIGTKVMNEIKAEVKGVITQILVENGKPVEFGQPMFKVRPT